VGCYIYRRRERAQPRLVWLRSFHTIYNPALAPKIVALLAADYPDIQLAMIGPDRGDGSLQATKQAAADLGVGGRIVMPGGVRKAEVSEWMNKGDIFINTTYVDNTPISVLEAMACGLCVVSSDVGGIPYLVTHAHDALLVPPGNPVAMANAVRCVLDQPGLARHLSENARATAEGFDWSVVLPQWHSLLCSLGEEVRP
jgi:glycosyltransferase involved in cell wall biosynthesis